MKNIRIVILSSICDWFGLNPQQFLEAPLEILSTSKIKERVHLSNEQKAWAMVCHFYTSDQLVDNEMDNEQVARFFKVDVERVKTGKNQHAFLTLNSQSYMVVVRKIEEIINRSLKPIYEPIEQ